MWLTRLLGLIPTIVSGVEAIHGSAKSGADKKTLALQALELAAAGALGLAPAQLQPAVNAATQLAGAVIDGTVNLYNQIGWPHEEKQKQFGFTPSK